MQKNNLITCRIVFHPS